MSGTIIDIGLLLGVAGVCGLIAQAVVGRSRGGCLAAIGIGFIGAILLLVMLRLLRI